jgi:SET domain-containing protein
MENDSMVNYQYNRDKGALFYVKESAIHGKGLFARKNIREGEVLGYIKGKPTTEDGPHVLWLVEKAQGIHVECDLKYINHNDNPNACYYDDLSVVALRDIEKDEEITHNYGEDWNDDSHPLS